MRSSTLPWTNADIARCLYGDGREIYALDLGVGEAIGEDKGQRGVDAAAHVDERFRFEVEVIDGGVEGLFCPKGHNGIALGQETVKLGS